LERLVVHCGFENFFSLDLLGTLDFAVSWYGHVLPEGAQTLEKLAPRCFAFDGLGLEM